MSSEQKYKQLMSNLKQVIKKLSHNELSREYVNLFAQHVLLQKQYDDLEAKNKPAVESAVQPVSSETKQETT